MQKMVGPDYLSLALAEPSRRALLENLRFGRKSVTELVQATQLKQPNVSNHLSKMRQQGIVRAERIGRQVYYSLAMPFADVLLRMHELAAHATPLSAEEQESEAGGLGARGDAKEADDPSDAHRSAVDIEMHAAENRAPSLEEWRETYFQAILAGREDKANELVNAMLSQRPAMETIYTEIFQSCLYRIGDLYRQGLTDEAHEHIASAITERMMMRVAHFHTPVLRTSHRAVLGCVAGNWHVIGLRMLADVLRSIGWDAIFMGANVPTESFVGVVEAMRPDLTAISYSLEDQREELKQLLSRLRLLRAKEGAHPFVIALGGHALLQETGPALLESGDLIARDLSEFLRQLAQKFSKETSV